MPYGSRVLLLYAPGDFLRFSDSLSGVQALDGISMQKKTTIAAERTSTASISNSTTFSPVPRGAFAGQHTLVERWRVGRPENPWRTIPLAQKNDHPSEETNLDYACIKRENALVFPVNLAEMWTNVITEAA